MFSVKKNIILKWECREYVSFNMNNKIFQNFLPEYYFSTLNYWIVMFFKIARTTWNIWCYFKTFYLSILTINSIYIYLQNFSDYVEMLILIVWVFYYLEFKYLFKTYLYFNFCFSLITLYRLLNLCSDHRWIRYLYSLDILLC